MTDTQVTDLTAELGTIREMAAQITDDHTVADCAADLGVRCTGHDAERLADAVEAVLAVHFLRENPHMLTGEDSRCGACGHQWPCTNYQAIRLAITKALLGDVPATEPAKCICPRFSDTGGFRIGDLCCPVHGVNGTEPLDGPWEVPADDN